MSAPTVPLKRMARVSYGLGQPPPEAPDGDGIPIIRATNIERGAIRPEGMMFAKIEDIPLDRAPLLEAGEVLVVRSGAYTGDSALVTDEWAGSAPGYDLRLTPHAETEPRYLAYQLLSAPVLHQIDLERSRAAQPHLNAEELGEIKVHFPPLPEQRAIADFLDRETTRIDTLITKKRALLETLQRRWLSRVYHAVTKGVGHSGAMRRSGLDWAGDIPAHWTVEPVYANYEVQLGKMLNPTASGGEHQAPYLRNVNVQWDRLDLDDLATMSFGAEERRKFRLRPGDLLVCEGGEVGKAAIWNGEIEECYYQKAVHRVRARTDRGNTRFLMYCLWAAASMKVFEVQGNQSTIPHLTAEKLREHRFPMPPAVEMAEIARELDAHRSQLAGLADRISLQIERLREHSSALIAEQVSGPAPIARQS